MVYRSRNWSKRHTRQTGVAQLVEHWSPKPRVVSSILTTRANKDYGRIRTYIEEAVDELTNKVSWPTWAELQSSGIVVLIATFIIAGLFI